MNTELPSAATKRAACVVVRTAWRGRSISSNASTPSRPVQWTGTPICSCSSSTTTSWPAEASARAATRPAGPAPTIATSRTWLFSEFPASGFPCASKTNPKRQENQSNVEQPRAPRDVETIVAKLLTAWHVARRIDLGNAGQPRAYRDARREAGHVLELHELAAVRFDLARPERARPDKAHVAAQDVPELRQLIHGGSPHQPADARHPRIAGARDDRTGLCLGVGAHRSELQRFERAAGEADPLLTEHHRTAVLELDRRGKEQPQRRGRDQAEAREQHVEKTLGHDKEDRSAVSGQRASSR